MSRSHRLPLVVALLALLVAFAAGCGDESSGDPGADPAAVVPARAPVYAEANLKPDDDIIELAKKLSGKDDPGAELKRLFEESTRENDPDFKFSEDVEPWLGERIGVFISDLRGADGDPPVAVVVPTKDSEKAKATLEAELREQDKGEAKPQVVERTHRDRKYLVDTAEDQAVVIIDDYAITGNDAAVKAAIDAREGEALAESGEYEQARDAVEEDGVGFAYVRLSQIFSGLGPQGAVLSQALQGVGDTIGIGVDGDESSIAVEAASLGAEDSGGPSGPGEVLATLPGDSWAAIGFADVGGRIDKAIEQLSQLGALGGQDPEQVLEQLERELGIDVRRDLASWLGDAGLFVMGDSPASVGGGLVAASKDAAATRRSIPKLARFLAATAQVRVAPLRRDGVDTGVTLRSAEVPLPIHMVLTDDERFVVAVTDRALDAVLAGGESLGDSATFKDAADSLDDGLEPAVFANFDPIVSLIQASGVAGSNPNADQVIKALERLTTLVAGSSRDGDTLRGRVVIGVK
jgi:hypothetical protein